MLGFDVSERSVSRWMRRAPRPPNSSQRWLAFLRNHREVIAAMDFFSVPTVTFSLLYVFFVIGHDAPAYPTFQCYKTSDQQLDYPAVARGVSVWGGSEVPDP
jgi:hypothetical protein